MRICAIQYFVREIVSEYGELVFRKTLAGAAPAVNYAQLLTNTSI